VNTKDKLKNILAEWQEYALPPLYERDFDYAYLDGNEILSIIGARRTGKTYLCYQIMQKLREKVPASNILYIDFEDERLIPLRGDELTLLWDTYLELSEIDPKYKAYLFIDEIQNAKNWSKWARRITSQNKNIKLVITGSSSKLLSQEIATELRGRSISFTVYPLIFSEYLKAKNIQFQKSRLPYGKDKIILKKAFTAYLHSGGFPATVSASKPEELLKEYFRVMFYRDLVDRYKIKNIRLFEDYLTLLLDQTACHFSISGTAKKLEGFGHSFSKNTLSNFSKYAREVFLVFEANKFSYKIKEQMRNPKKIYAIDHALVSAVRFSFSEDTGRILENIVYLALKKSGQNIFYYSGKKECDFVLFDKGRATQAVQVCKSLSDRATKEREAGGLAEAARFFKLKEGLILTEDENETFSADGLPIKAMPIWQWLLR
jgi:predicted AAA+ superfamily ATPase